MDEVIMSFGVYPTEIPTLIKVIGVGGGGGNAVSHMYREGMKNVSFAICNTDNQALLTNKVPVKLQLGPQTTKGLGAGGAPKVAQKAAEESVGDIKKLLSDETKMIFITAGMGGGTGTGAAPVIAQVAQEMDILTVGIVTIPFNFEGEDKIYQALLGVEEMSRYVDALLVIDNERLLDIYADLDIDNGFQKADDILTVAAQSIADIISVPGTINVDFADVSATLKKGGIAIMSSGLGKGANRISKAIENTLNSPLVNNNDIFKARKILLNISYDETNPPKMKELNEVKEFMSKFSQQNINVIWGRAKVNNLEDNVRITILATGFDIDNVPMIDKIENRTQAAIEQREKEKLFIKYGKDLDKINKPVPSKPFIFTVEQMDDNEIIEAVLNIPAYKRKGGEIEEIIERREAKMKSTVPLDEVEIVSEE
ncbi:MAG: cell division protein FtsZ [Dysgonamonadaceae bacterium]|jgi:cell division protein FtsZ|nr:cell division protein FtsZ [Dysgonamonadaceae bacterium]